MSTTENRARTASPDTEVAALRAKAGYHFAIASLLLVVVGTFQFRLGAHRVPDGRDKTNLLRATELASIAVPRRRRLDLIGLSPNRLQAWRRRRLQRKLDGHSTCPKQRPSRLAPEEVQQIKRHVLAPGLRHMSLPCRRPSCSALRTGLRHLFHVAPIDARARLAATPNRVHPPRPAVRIRARAPDEWWHLDVTVIRLRNGAEVYLHAVHAVMDNHRSSSSAGIHVHEDADVHLLTDSGIENVNQVVDGFLAPLPIRCVLAQVEIAESNSMIEAFWKSLRRQWLYLIDWNPPRADGSSSTSHLSAQRRGTPLRPRWPNTG